MKKLGFAYYGGKLYALNVLLPLIPEHTTYVEVFGGSAALLLNKKPAINEVYNDIDKEIVTFFRVLRDPDKGKELIRRLKLTPYAREEFRMAIEMEPKDDIEAAWAAFVKLYMSFKKTTKSTIGSFAYAKGQKKDAFRFANKVDTLPLIQARLRNVTIECLDFRDIIPRYDTNNTFFFVDPPYLKSTCDPKAYKQIMTEDEHKQLVELLLKVKGKVMLTIFWHDIYQPLINAGWTRLQKTRIICSGKVSQRKRKQETILLNYPPPTIPTLLTKNSQ